MKYSKSDFLLSHVFFNSSFNRAQLGAQCSYDLSASNALKIWERLKV